MKKQNSSLRIWSGILLICLFLLVGFTGLSARLYDLQFQEKQRLDQASRVQRFAVVYRSPQRGLITDRCGRVLAASNTIYNVFAEPRLLQDAERYKLTAAALQTILELPGHELAKQIFEARNPGFVRILRDITPAQRDAIADARIPGVGIEEVPKRYYPAGPLTGHVIGFIGAESTGLAGLELKYDSLLQGKQGRVTYVVDVQRRPLAADPEGRAPVQNGNNLVLTIDAVIQQYVRQALKNQMEAYEAESAVGLVMDPWTGAILAMVSLPDYDPKEFSTASDNQLKNRILTDPYEPGSIFKPIVAAIALDSGTITAEEKFDCEDGYWASYGGIHEFGNHQFGMLNVREIILHSSNIGMAKIGLKMNQRTLHDGLRLFGFASPTGVDLTGEDPGLLRPTSQWSKYSPTRIAFGHEVSVTAIQIAQAYCILANGGTLIQPHLVRAVVDADGNLTDVTHSVAGAGYVLKPETVNWMVQEALTAVVEEGTGDKAAIEGVKVFGKTGTANIALPTGGYDTSNYVSTFVGGAPADNPRVIVLVSLRKPNRSLGKGYSGGRVATPVFREILENTLAYLDSY